MVPPQQSKTVEEKLKTLRTLLENVSRTNAQDQILQIERLAAAKDIDDFIIDERLATDYTFWRLLDEVFRYLRNISARQTNFINRIRDIHLLKGLTYKARDNTFESWIREYFLNNKISIIKTIELCSELFSGSHEIPFSFITTQVIRLFYFPTTSVVKFLKLLSVRSTGDVIATFTQPPKQEIKQEIIRFTPLMLSARDAIRPFNNINNTGLHNHSEEDTTGHVAEIKKTLTFHVIPDGYNAYAHTDYRKNLYLSDNFLSKSRDDYEGIMISAISLFHETVHLKRIESAFYYCPLEFTPPQLKYEAGFTVETEVFGGLVDIDDIKGIDVEECI